MHVRLSEDAEADLHAIFDFIAAENPVAATRVIDAIITTALHLESFPFLGKEGRMRGTRELVTPGWPYVLVYSLADEFYILVERILHGARMWPTEVAE